MSNCVFYTYIDTIRHFEYLGSTEVIYWSMERRREKKESEFCHNRRCHPHTQTVLTSNDNTHKRDAREGKRASPKRSFDKPMPSGCRCPSTW